MSALFLALSLPVNVTRAEPLLKAPVHGHTATPCSTGCAIHMDAGKTLKVTDSFSGISFTEISNPTPNFGFSNQVYFLKFRISNPGEYADFMIQVDYAPLQRIDFYIPEEKKLVQTGAALPFHSRPVPHRTFVFPVHIPPGEARTILFRFESEGTLEFPILAMTADTFRDRIHEEQLVLGLYYGILTVLIVYNLILFFMVRDPGYLYYLLYVLGYGLIQTVLNGFAYEYFWPGSPYWNSKSLVFAIGWAFFFGIMFAREFLRSGRLVPRLDKFLYLLMLLLFFLMPAAFILPYNLSIRAAAVLALLFTGSIFLTAFACVMRGYGPARYFLVAWFSLLVGVTAYALKGLGILPANFFTEYVLQMGSALEMCLLSLGLADRIRVNEEERQKASQAAMESSREKEAAKLTAARLEIELLKKNIQPHFLMNSLNAATVWLEEDPGTARRLIEALSEEMRLLLRISPEKVIPVSDEIALCRAHLDVMGLRLEKQYALNVIGISGNETIPPLVFHTLIENGLTHGLHGRSGGVFSIEKCSESGFDVFHIGNDGEISNRKGTGTGMKYVASRLDEAYPGKWKLDHGPIESGGYRTSIWIPVDPSPMQFTPDALK
ncbi:MAG: histidine kinase [Spirochaetia bacterium]|nr:histidine kinase [Spirochaetia bacterium]